MKEHREGRECGECGYFSAVHPYKEGICLKHVSTDARKSRLVFKHVGASDPACDQDFVLFKQMPREGSE